MTKTEATAKSETFVSIVSPVHDSGAYVEAYIREVSDILSEHFQDYEIVLIDAGSQDDTVAIIQQLQSEIRNLQLYCLPRPIPKDNAFVVGVEKAIGDVVITVDPCYDPPAKITELLEPHLAGNDVVYGIREDRLGRHTGESYNAFARIFYRIYHKITGIDLPVGVSTLRLLSRRAVNTLLDNAERYDLFVVITSFSGLRYSTVPYKRINRADQKERTHYWQAIGRALNLLLLSSHHSLRLRSIGSLSAASINVIYSLYVVTIALLKDEVAEGWVSMSLQISGMFLLMFVVLAILSEYVIRLFMHSQNRWPYVIVQESSSLILSKKDEPNVLVGASDTTQLAEKSDT
jgi:glycosyltransferase involved in cell wall biosynthesis